MTADISNATDGVISGTAAFRSLHNMATTLKYKTNLNCGSCVAAVKPYMDQDEAIDDWSVDTNNDDKVLTVTGNHVTDEQVRQHVSSAGFAVLGQIDSDTDSSTASASSNGSYAQHTHDHSAHRQSDQKSFWQTYRPLLLIVAYLVGVTAVAEFTAGSFDAKRAMQNFMGGFFLAFSFFKLLDLRGFVDAFQSYDVVARPMRAYGYVYPFIELSLGVAYLTGVVPVATNAVTLVVMLVGITGVSQALLRKQQIQCACLGTVFDLPMSKVTFIEDGVMTVMAAAMLWMLLA